MDKLKLKDTRIKKVVEPDTMLNIYKGLVNDYIKSLYSNYNNIKDTWMFEYYENSHVDLIKECEEFTNNQYTLNVPFINACKLYNIMSEEFDRIENSTCINTELTKDIVNTYIELISLNIHFLKNIFKIEKE